MKKDQHMFSLNGNIRKYTAWANVRRFWISVKGMHAPEVFALCNCHHEKLQIIYANIRV